MLVPCVEGHRHAKRSRNSPELMCAHTLLLISLGKLIKFDLAYFFQRSIAFTRTAWELALLRRMDQARASARLYLDLVSAASR